MSRLSGHVSQVLSVSCLALSLLTLGHTRAFAGTDDWAPATVSVALQAESIELPFSFSGLRSGVLHPGIEAGVEWELWGRGMWHLGWGAQFGYYFHEDLQHGAYLVPALAGEARATGGLVGRADVGLGALHTWSEPEAFELQADGTYEPSTDWGRVRLMPRAGVGAGWAFEQSDRPPVEVFLRYTVFFEIPFSPPNDIPAMFHTLTQVGVRFGWPGSGG
ncbi:hypothetical protein FIV42_26520 [Persicimonas caeni]|uniref:Porin family protein n=1 Tax=Persicimonas caeni TaxID=2292766 RepID=A0A4Y6Q1W4_PERCE|nr:hypothetical protein [Persicimonas caeni]QDG54167.1 hypothetical protein FIV42_26520 [Persicimonas caeni]QED35388.1 hypothetical protein FRD00_26515 [Persicimonas caeni]